MSADSTLIKRVENLLVQQGNEPANLLQVLDLVLAHFNCVTGTIHGLDLKSGLLVLLAQRGIPEIIMDKVSRIPVGKGMAGIAAERKQPVQVCNLQTDASGVAKPGAKETRMEGSVAVPMLVDATILRGVLGVAKPVAYEFSAAELESLSAIASLIGKHLGRPTKQEILDQYFIEVRHKLIEVAAFLDRVDRAEGEDDFRIKAFRAALKELERAEPERAKQILLALSDPTTQPIPAAKGKSAAGAWPGETTNGHE
jgi:signal transduction protein with GAF and PtsI domain